MSGNYLDIGYKAGMRDFIDYNKRADNMQLMKNLTSVSNGDTIYMLDVGAQLTTNQFFEYGMKTPSKNRDIIYEAAESFGIQYITSRPNGLVTTYLIFAKARKACISFASWFVQFLLDGDITLDLSKARVFIGTKNIATFMTKAVIPVEKAMDIIDEVCAATLAEAALAIKATEDFEAEAAEAARAAEEVEAAEAAEEAKAALAAQAAKEAEAALAAKEAEATEATHADMVSATPVPEAIDWSRVRDIVESMLEGVPLMNAMIIVEMFKFATIPETREALRSTISSTMQRVCPRGITMFDYIVGVLNEPQIVFYADNIALVIIDWVSV